MTFWCVFCVALVLNLQQQPNADEEKTPDKSEAKVKESEPHLPDFHCRGRDEIEDEPKFKTHAQKSKTHLKIFGKAT